MKSLARRLSWGLMALLAAVVAIVFAGPYASFNPAVSRLSLNHAIPIHFIVLAIHASTGGIALLIGPFQFLTRLRSRYPQAHRTLGRIYLLCILIGSVFALLSALFSVASFVARIGFTLLALLWLYSASQAYRAIRQRQIQLHRVWMVRNYALTFAGVTLRLWLPFGLAVLHLTFPVVYATSAWISWTVPLMVAEWGLNQRFLRTLVFQKELTGNQ